MHILKKFIPSFFIIPIHPPLPWGACFFLKQLIQSPLVHVFSVVPYNQHSLVWLKSHVVIWPLESTESYFPFLLQTVSYSTVFSLYVKHLHDWQTPNHSSSLVSKHHLLCAGSTDLLSSGRLGQNFTSTLIASCIFVWAKYASVIGLLWRLNKIIHVKDSTECLARSKCSSKC